MGPRELAKASQPLKLVISGMLLVVLDFNLGVVSGNGRHFFDLLNDSLGLLLVTVGLGRLCGLKLGSLNEGVLAGITGAAAVFLVVSVVKQVRPELLEGAATTLTILGAVGTACLLAFCLVMRAVSLSAGLASAARSWSTTLLLVLIFNVLSPAILRFASPSLLPETDGSTFGLAAIASLAMALPFVHSFLSAARMCQALPSLPPDRAHRGTV